MMGSTTMISYFKNVSDKHPVAISFGDFINSIKTGTVNDYSLIDIINDIRMAPNKETKNELKKKLPAVTISALCDYGHKKSDIIKFTGFIQIDIDDLPNPEETKNILKEDAHLYVAFTSPGGKGLKCIFFMGDQEHKQIFDALKSYLKTKYTIEIDNQVKDESRLCYYSYDPDVFINGNYSLFKYSSGNSVSEINKLKNDVENILTQIENSKTDITSSYEDWRNIGFSFADAFGTDGGIFFHRVSKFNNSYDYEKCSKQFSSSLNSGNKGITIRTFFKLAKDNGFQISEGKRKTDDVFFYPVLDRDGNTKDIKIDYPKWIDILYKLGFRRFDIEKSFVFTRIIDQIIEEVSVTHIQDAFINYLEKLPDNLHGGISRESLISKFYRNPSHYFCENRLNLLRPKSNFNFSADTKDECFIYFSNGFVKCTKTGYKLLPYSELNGLIWHDQIVNSSFVINDFNSDPPENRGDFSHFVFNISSKNRSRYDSLCSIIGYLLHSYYIGKLKAVVLTDSKISETPSGRTGKTLFCQALKYIKKYTEINGKDFDPSNKHKYQQANLDTQITHVNDVRKNFDFECLFNDITEGIVVDKKNTKPFRISTKLIVSTNQTIRIEGASAKDRAIEFEFAEHYNEKFSPENEFGHWFFRDWNDDEWSRFFNFCMNCICTYLENGVVLAAQINLNKRKLFDSTCHEFVEFMEAQIDDGNIIAGSEYDKKELYERFLTDSPEFKDQKNFKPRKFTEWLRAYTKYSGHFSPIDPEKHERKSGAARYITFPPP